MKRENIDKHMDNNGKMSDLKIVNGRIGKDKLELNYTWNKDCIY